MIDVMLIVMLISAGALGWRRGGVFAGTACGIFVGGGLVAASVAVAIGSSLPAFVFLLGGLLATVPIALRGRVVMEFVEDQLTPRARMVDRVAGVVVLVTLALAFSWYVAALASVVPGSSRGLTSVRTAELMKVLVDKLPPQGTLGALVLRSGLLPAINGPIVIATAPLASFAAAPAVLAARASVVQVRGVACGNLVTGTAWVARPGLLVTDAHVVAGQHETAVAGGPAFAGALVRVTAFDPVNDLAVLAIDRPLPPPLPLGLIAPHGTPAAVIGFPFGREQQVIPARVDRVADYETTPITGGEPQPAKVFAFRADVEPGNSGGPVLDLEGRVLGMVVAKGLGQRVDAGYGVAAPQLAKIIAEGARGITVSTGECLPPE